MFLHASSSDGKQHKVHEFDMLLPLEIMDHSHTWHDYPWPWVLTWLLYNLQLDDKRPTIHDDITDADFEKKFIVRFRPIRKEMMHVNSI